MSRTYYFSSKSRKFEDGTRKYPFSDFAVLESLDLQSGDSILIRRNSVFTGQAIHLYGKDNITISSYGNGAMPVIDSQGAGVWHQDYGIALDNPNHRYSEDVSSTVLLFDCNGIRLEKVHLKNTDISGADYSYSLKIARTGVAVVAKDRGTISGIELSDLYISSVHGNVYDKHLCNGGIFFVALKPSNETLPASRFDNVRLTGCFVKDTSRWAISVGYTYMWSAFTGTAIDDSAFKEYAHTNIVVEDCYVKDIGGDGITVLYALRPVVSHCRADSVSKEMNDRVYTEPLTRQGKVAAAVWAWKCLDAYFEFNEVYDTNLNQDGMAYDADSGWNTRYENNYSHSNEGGAMMFCLEEAVGSEFRNNISDDDLGGVFSPASCPDGVFEDNTIYRRESVPLLRARMSDGKFELKNNREIIIERKR